MKQTLYSLFGLALALTLSSSAFAGTVKFSEGLAIDVAVGSSFSVTLVGEGFNPATDGAAFALAWNPTVISYVSTTAANPPWDASFVSADNASSGVIDYVFLGKSTSGGAGSSFNLATFNFNVVGAANTSSALTLSIDPYNIGFIAGQTPVNATFINSQVNVVPVPAAAWLFGSALLSLLGISRRA